MTDTRERARDAEWVYVICSFCGATTEYDQTQENAQADAILAHIKKCKKLPAIHERNLAETGG